MTKRPKRGRPPLGHTVELSVRMSPELLRAVKRSAKVCCVSVAEFVRAAVAFHSGFTGGKQ